MGRTVFSHRVLRLFWCVVALAAATTATALPADSKAPDMAAVGAQITTIIKERQADALASLLDMNELGARVAENVFENETGRGEFVRGFTKTCKGQDAGRRFLRRDGSLARQYRQVHESRHSRH
jgi:hypothetical protein